ncbi:MAG: DUF2235 domain-containing protein [Leptolyngbya sp. UWPOB_LEPTO1]|uniref:DUF2235 domain-containing protein n=1 Tax=Leptolyngbya sp. UWPOB_LEPTO1 TaxID=2815653 RepID=UPI001AD1ECA8|nr:DUF2235 domain-containing protein [Leptolyngbya sp. UWPOB_LEPTO1]MBN8561051.1 DUF2235 domain-containing protein [Leptolyngbya sp. UWPOB_LEPTO1]
MKRLVVCCDGTWQQLSSDYPTNVVKMAQAVKPIDQNGVSQIVYYSEGLGTGDKFDKLTGGAFGWGIDQAIQKAYRFLCLNYVRGDEIYLFGFSRGAYIVRSLAGLIYCSGLLDRAKIREIPEAYQLYRDRNIKPNDSEAIQFREKNGESVPITLLGCWDTVGELGVPNQIPFLPIDDWMNTQYQFHDTHLNRQIQTAFHAVAIDERRQVFDVTRMQVGENSRTTLHQVWFPGGHGCVGGGSEANRGLSDAALLWMIEMMKSSGLELEVDTTRCENGIEINCTKAFDSGISSIYKLSRQHDRALLDPDDPQAVFNQCFFDNNIHLSVKRRWKQSKPPYRPVNLEPYKRWFEVFAEEPNYQLSR